VVCELSLRPLPNDERPPSLALTYGTTTAANTMHTRRSTHQRLDDHDDDIDDRDAEEAIRERCLHGDPQGWADFDRRFGAAMRASIVHTLRRHGAPPDDDLVHDLYGRVTLSLMIKDAQRLRTFQGRSRLSTWVRVLAANATIDHLRRRRPMVRLADHEGEPGCVATDPSDPTCTRLAKAQLIHGLRALWRQLSEDDQRFIDLFFVQELDFATISAQTGDSVAALYARKSRAQKRLVALAERAGWFAHLDPQPRTNSPRPGRDARAPRDPKGAQT